MCGLEVRRGARTRIAKECGLTPSAIAQWHKVPAEYCAIVSSITGHDVQVLRPDIFSRAAA
jgi:DNA-binding transcriptional regulator YdaS (Cro superfamily)